MLFNDTLANNIAYGSLSGAGADAVEAAARAAHVMEFVQSRRGTAWTHGWAKGG